MEAGVDVIVRDLDGGEVREPPTGGGDGLRGVRPPVTGRQPRGGPVAGGHGGGHRGAWPRSGRGGGQVQILQHGVVCPNLVLVT